MDKAQSGNLSYMQTGLIFKVTIFKKYSLTVFCDVSIYVFSDVNTISVRNVLLLSIGSHNDVLFVMNRLWGSSTQQKVSLFITLYKKSVYGKANSKNLDQPAQSYRLFNAIDIHKHIAVCINLKQKQSQGR